MVAVNSYPGPMAHLRTSDRSRILPDTAAVRDLQTYPLHPLGRAGRKEIDFMQIAADFLVISPDQASKNYKMKNLRSILLSAVILAASAAPSQAGNLTGDPTGTLALSPAVQLDTLTSEIPQQSGSRNVYDGLKNEISASYGVLTLLQVEYGLSGIFETVFSGGLIQIDHLRGHGAFSLSYYRAVNSWLSVGADFAIEHVSMTYHVKDSQETKETSETAFSPMLTLKCNWLRRAHFGMYSRLSAGAMFMKSPASGTVRPAFTLQASPIGAEFGGTALRGFVEGGFGAQGCIMGGLRFRF